MTTDLSQTLFARKVFLRMPAEIRNSFSAEQIEAMQKAFGDPWARHPLDIRRTIGFWRFRYYVVLLGGPERRDTRSRKSLIFRISELIFYITFITLSFSFGLFILYLLKSAFEINIF